jgi:predicted Zn-dependent protease
VKTTVDQGIDTAIEKSPEVVERTVASASEAIGKVLRPRERNDAEPNAPEGTVSEGSRTKDSKPQGRQAKDSKKSTTDPIGFVSDVFNLGRQAAKATDDVGQDLFALDPDQERDVGREVHQMISKDHAILRLPEQQSRVERLAQPLLNLCRRKDLTYSFSVIDGDEINAFSHLGGYIYLHKGLLNFAASDVELQNVIGHEIAHVELKHCLRNLTYSAHLQKWTPDAVGGVAQLAYNMIALGYSEDFEFEADEWSFRSQIRLGRSREQATSFARHYLDYVTSRGIETENRRPESASDAVVQEVENHFRSHPAARERLRRLEKLPLNTDQL